MQDVLDLLRATETYRDQVQSGEQIPPPGMTVAAFVAECDAKIAVLRAEIGVSADVPAPVLPRYVAKAAIIAVLKADASWDQLCAVPSVAIEFATRGIAREDGGLYLDIRDEEFTSGLEQLVAAGIISQMAKSAIISL